MFDLTPIVSLCATVILAIASRYLIPLIRSKWTDEQINTAKTWATIAVKAAEMIYNGPGRGEEKKAEVMRFLNSKGFKLDEDELDKIVESAVLELQKL